MNFVSKIIEKLVDIKFFKLIFLISCIFYCIPFTNDFFSKAFKIFIFWGIILFLYNFFFNKKYTLKKQDYLLFGFLAIALIGCFINYKSNLILNIISVVYLFIQIILMLSYNKYKNIDEKIKEYKIFSYILIVFTFICSVFSILIFLLNVKYSYTDGFQQIIYGVFEGRLWGFYSNPNTLGQISIISIWTSILLLIINKNYNKKTNKFLNGFICLNILCEFICLILSNSRSAVIGFSLSIAIFSLFMIAYNNMRKDQNIFVSIFKNKINTFVKMLAIGIFIGLSAFILKNSMAFFADEFKDVSIINNVDNIDNDHEDDSEEKDKESGKVKVDREFATSDVSNGRFEIWNAGIKVFRLYPIFGVGSKNVNEISNKFMSEETLLISPKISENMHNIFLQILVSHGILAFIIFISYLIYILLKYLIFIFKFEFTNNKNNQIIYKLFVTNFSLLCSLLVINLFDSNILYFCSILLAYSFWTTISNINSTLDLYENDNKKVLFMIDSLETGGAEKALIDLTNNLKNKNYKIEVKTIYNEGKYIEKLNKNIKYSYVIKKPNIWKKRIFYRMVKYLPTKLLYQLIINEIYDVEIAYHELMSTKILSGSDSNAFKVAWIHTNMFSTDKPYQMFSNYVRFVNGYDNFDKVVCVSNNIKEVFEEKTKLYQKTLTIYNPIDKENILKLSEKKCELRKSKDKFLIVTIGRLENVKGYDKLCRVIKKLKDNKNNVELWILGEGSEKNNLENYIKENNLEENIKLLGFKENPYNYLKEADLFISTSLIEGFSLVVAEAIILGLPVISTNTDGPKEILDNGKYGVLVSHDESDIYNELKNVINNKDVLKELRKKSNLRKDYFELSDTINKVNDLINFYDINIQENELLFTVFTPTYNRAYIIHKVYESLKRQTYRNFEWVVVDDGSSDETEELFNKWKKEKNDFQITYLKVQNGGKQKAINKGVDLAKGKMFFNVDSDDHLTDDALEKTKNCIDSIKGVNGFAGVAGLRGYTNDTIIGTYNKNKYVDCTNLEREKYNITGDKAEVYYTEILKKYKFPNIPNEKFITERLVWDKIAFEGYKMRWFNDVLTRGEYLEDGYTKDGMSLYVKSPTGYLLYIRNQKVYYPLDIKQKIGDYYRYYSIVKDKKTKEEIANELLTSKLFLNFAIFLKEIKSKIKGR